MDRSAQAPAAVARFGVGEQIWLLAKYVEAGTGKGANALGGRPKLLPSLPHGPPNAR